MYAVDELGSHLTQEPAIQEAESEAPVEVHEIDEMMDIIDRA